jgi:hypothetical protein
MLKISQYFASLLLFLCLSTVLVPSSHGKGYKGFKLLNPDECTQLDKKVVSQLPVEWHKYADFIKACKLKDKNTAEAKVSIITIWAHDYLSAKGPGAEWENFPLPIIVDINLNQIGQLPELYPMDWVTHLDVYYGKWKSGIPSVIMIDVENPAVTGDYYYAPLNWSKKDGQYKMKNMDVTSGKRPKK